MNLEAQLNQLEQDISANKRLIDLAKSLERLESNRDFKKIINEGFMKDEAVRLVHLKADPAMQAEHKQVAIIKEIDAIGSLASFLAVIRVQGRNAERALADDEATREEINKELLNG